MSDVPGTYDCDPYLRRVEEGVESARHHTQKYSFNWGAYGTSFALEAVRSSLDADSGLQRRFRASFYDRIPTCVLTGEEQGQQFDVLLAQIECTVGAIRECMEFTASFDEDDLPDRFHVADMRDEHLDGVMVMERKLFLEREDMMHFYRNLYKKYLRQSRHGVRGRVATENGRVAGHLLEKFCPVREPEGTALHDLVIIDAAAEHPVIMEALLAESLRNLGSIRGPDRCGQMECGIRSSHRSSRRTD